MADLLLAARAWEALCRHADAAPGSPESREIATDIMAILIASERTTDRANSTLEGQQ